MPLYAPDRLTAVNLVDPSALSPQALPSLAPSVATASSFESVFAQELERTSSNRPSEAGQIESSVQSSARTPFDQSEPHVFRPKLPANDAIELNPLVAAVAVQNVPMFEQLELTNLFTGLFVRSSAFQIDRAQQVEGPLSFSGPTDERNAVPIKDDHEPNSVPAQVDETPSEEVERNTPFVETETNDAGVSLNTQLRIVTQQPRTIQAPQTPLQRSDSQPEEAPIARQTVGAYNARETQFSAFSISPTAGAGGSKEFSVLISSRAAVDPQRLPLETPNGGYYSVIPSKLDLDRPAPEVVNDPVTDQFTNVIAQQLEENVQQGTTTIRIQLDCAELGAVNLCLFMSNGTLSVRLAAQNPRTARLLDERKGNLLKSLGNRGISCIECEVDCDGDEREPTEGHDSSPKFADQRDAGIDRRALASRALSQEPFANNRLDFVA